MRVGVVRVNRGSMLVAQRFHQSITSPLDAASGASAAIISFPDLSINRGEDALLLLLFVCRRVVLVLGALLDDLNRELQCIGLKPHTYADSHSRAVAATPYANADAGPRRVIAGAIGRITVTVRRSGNASGEHHRKRQNAKKSEHDHLPYWHHSNL
jgi:hypothetical protein